MSYVFASYPWPFHLSLTLPPPLFFEPWEPVILTLLFASQYWAAEQILKRSRLNWSKALKRLVGRPTVWVSPCGRCDGRGGEGCLSRSEQFIALYFPLSGPLVEHGRTNWTGPLSRSSSCKWLFALRNGDPRASKQEGLARD